MNQTTVPISKVMVAVGTTKTNKRRPRSSCHALTKPTTTGTQATTAKNRRSCFRKDGIASRLLCVGNARNWDKSRPFHNRRPGLDPGSRCLLAWTLHRGRRDLLVARSEAGPRVEPGVTRVRLPRRRLGLGAFRERDTASTSGAGPDVLREADREGAVDGRQPFAGSGPAALGGTERQGCIERLGRGGKRSLTQSGNQGTLAV